MNALAWLDQSFSQRFALTLLHFVWQGVTVALIMVVAGGFFRRAAAQLRYSINVVAMLVMMACLPLTFAQVGAHRLSRPDAASSRETSTASGRVTANPRATESRSSRSEQSDFSAQHGGLTARKNNMALADGSRSGPPSANSLETSDERAKPSQALAWIAPHLTLVYFAGVMLMMLRLTMALWGGRKLRLASTPLDDNTLLALIERQARRIGLKIAPAVAVCEQISIPVVVGVVKPMILLPATLASGLSPDQLRALLTHELAHIRRYDLLVNLLQRLIEAVLFFHPAVWYVSRRVSIERENACDDIVLMAGWQRASYADALVRMAERSSLLRHSRIADHGTTLSASGANPSEFKRRVLRLLDREPRVRLTRSGIVGVLLLLVLVMTAPLGVQSWLDRAIAQQDTTAMEIDARDDSRGTEDEARRKRTVEQISRQRKQVAEDLIPLLRNGKFDRVADHFSAKLQHALSGQKLRSMWSAISDEHGQFENGRQYGLQRFGDVRLWLIVLRWEKVELELRIDFDDENRINGLWLDQRTGVEAPEGFRDGGQPYGDRIKQIAQANLSLEARVIDFDGQPVKKSSIAYWREVSPDEEPASSDWNDPATEKVWRQFEACSTGSTTTYHFLKPGWYLVTARRGHNSMMPFGASQPVQLDRSKRHHVVTVLLKPGGTMHFVPVDVADGQRLKRAYVVLSRQDSVLPPNMQIRPRREDSVLIYEHLPPGRYRVSGSRRAAGPDGLEYAIANDSPEVEITAGEKKEMRVALQGRPLTEKEKSSRWPWIVTGRVTDADGNPIQGAEIYASAGWGSLGVANIATTDENGRYRGRFGQSGWTLVDSDPDPLNLVSAQVGARKDGFAEADLNRQGGMHAAYRRPMRDEEVPNYVDTDRLFIRGEPQEVNFILLPAADITVQMLDAGGRPLDTKPVRLDGKELPPASSVIASGTTEASGTFTFTEVPTGYDWWLEVNLQDRRYARSSPMKFAARKYELVLQHRVEELTQYDRLQLVSAKDAEGNDVRDRILADDPYLRPPVEAALQEKGRDILRKVRDVNRFWLAGPPVEVKTYAYDFKLQGEQPQSITITNPAHHSIYQRRGISYYSAIDYVTAKPDKVVFRDVADSDKRIELVYALKEPVRVSAGNGVAGKWRGYFSMNVREGKLIIDPKTHTLIEHQTEGLTEKLSRYVEVRDGYYVPLRISIDKMQIDWTFQLHEPGLWLFNKSFTPKENDEPIAKVENVVINQTRGDPQRNKQDGPAANGPVQRFGLLPDAHNVYRQGRRLGTYGRVDEHGIIRDATGRALGVWGIDGGRSIGDIEIER